MVPCSLAEDGGDQEYCVLLAEVETADVVHDASLLVAYWETFLDAGTFVCTPALGEVVGT